MIEITDETFDAIACKLQDDLVDIIQNNTEVNDYELIVYKYIFISELKFPLLDELDIEIAEDYFVLYVIPDDLEFGFLRKIDDVFDRFEITFMPNSYGLIKMKFTLNGV